MYDNCFVSYECLVFGGEASSICVHKRSRVIRVEVHLVSGVYDANIMSRDMGASGAMSVLGVETAWEQAAPAPDAIAIRRIEATCAA